jgi:uncharacterized protein
MKIIDSHCHLGISKLSGRSITESDLLTAMDAYKVDISLVMPHAIMDDSIAAHNAVADLCQQHPERFRGMVNLSPLWDEADYRQEVTRCVRDLGFVSLKLNPMQHLTSPLMKNSNKVFDAAADLGVPVIVHTGLGAPWALPSLSIPQARRHPDLPIILAHAGFAVYTSEAYVAAVECDNIYLEPSWCTIFELKWLINELGADRILFGSDLPENLPVELVKYQSLNLTPEELAACLGDTAARLFQIN